ncbi:TrbC/VirB2 family protein [Salmonella enterica]
MESLVNKRGAGRTLPLLAMLAFAALFAVEPAFAQGGLDKVNTFMDNVLSILRGVSITVVTIAIMWAGYKFLFKHADIAESAKILAGGLLIGGAAELARFLLS